ncbi:hypothetical protein [Clostridium baratii]|uniref:hypothetical protein n=1 Tax=Clostridium baratii TaxID=1561 RepID=UPI0030CC5045
MVGLIKKILKNNITKIILIGVFIVAFSIIAFKTFDKKDDKNNNQITNNTTIVNNDSTSSKTEEKSNDNKNDSDTTVVWEGSDSELIKKNRLLEDSNKSIKDRLEAKDVAEKFVKAITIIDVKDTKKSLNEALQYVGDEEEKSILENEFRNAFGRTGIKEVKLKKMTSYEVRNEDNNDYIIFEVNDEFDYVDKHNQIIEGGNPYYKVTLLKIDGKFKVISCRLDH